jgi:hypothetical protein
MSFNRISVFMAAAPLILIASSAPWASQVQPGLIAHEWGTFTSLQDSEGHSREGLYHEDELLPDFVHSRLKDSFARVGGQAAFLADYPHPGHGKGVEFPPKSGTAFAVTQKMETPVIYFYSPTSQRVKVDVEFPGGLITQWYPQASSYSPAVGSAQAVSNGQISWDVEVTKNTLSIPSVENGSIWSPARQVGADFVSAGGENEKMLFYRGLGHFNTAFNVASSVDGGLVVSNGSEQTVPSAFLIAVNAQGGSISALGSVTAQHSVKVVSSQVASPAFEAMDVYLGHATSQIAAALVQSGLYPDEAQAMVNTWKKSYFVTPGLRVLYVLPRAWTDQLLPLHLQPAPSELVRTLVGRIEVMTGAEEERLLAIFQHADAKQIHLEVSKLGRFAEPKLRRIAELARERGLSLEIQNLLSTQEDLASQGLD